MFLLTLLLLIIVPPVFSLPEHASHGSLINTLIAYDCSQYSTNVTTLSLIDQPTCDDFPETYHLDEEKVIQVLYRAERTPVHVYHCKLIIQFNRKYCGMHHHISMLAGDGETSIYQFQKKECLDLHMTNTFHYLGRKISNIGNNGTTSAYVGIAGWVDHGGKCENGKVPGKHQLGEHILYVNMMFELYDYQALVNINSKAIEMKDGVHCSETDTNCIHPNLGHSYWRTLLSSGCQTKEIKAIWQGKAKIYSLHVNGQLLKYYFINTETHLFSLKKKEPTAVCQENVFSTDQTRIFISEKTVHRSFLHTYSRVETSDLDMTLYLNTKVMALELNQSISNSRLTRTLIERICHVESETIRSFISLALTNPHIIGYRYLNKPGVIGIHGGEAIHILSCTPIPVRLRSTDHCYHSLPVSYNNASIFMEPVTRIVV